MHHFHLVTKVGTEISLVKPGVASQCDQDSRAESKRTPVHRFHGWVWCNREHVRDQEAEQEQNGNNIDDIPRPLSKVEWRGLFKVTSESHHVTVVQTAANAQYVRCQKTAVSNGLNVDECCGRSKRNECQTTANCPSQQNSVGRDVSIRGHL